MPYGLIDYDTLHNIAESIRYKANTNVNYYPRDFARAINGIRSGGFDEPVFYSLQRFYNNGSDNQFITRGSLFKFEVTNEDPSNLAGYWNLGNINYEGVFDGEATFYCRSYTLDNMATGLAYGLYVGPDYRNASLLCIDELFNNSLIIDGYCGKYTTSMRNAYSYSPWIENAVCGPKVQFMKSAYAYCSNLKHSNVGDSVIDMRSAFLYCINLQEGVSGNNVIYMDEAYRDCSNMHSLDIGPNVIYAINTAYQASNLLNCTGGESVIYGTNAFQRCYNLKNIEPMPNLIYGNGMFQMCRNLSQNSYYDFITNATHLIMAVNMFNECNNITDAYLPNSIVYTRFMYANCHNLINAYIDDNLNVYSDFYGTFYGCENLVNVTGGSNLVSLYGMFYGCRNLETPLITPNAINLTDAYAYTKISVPYCGENTTLFGNSYKDCYYIVDAVCGDNVINMYNAYYNCSNLVNAACGNKVVEMNYTYFNCQNLTSYVIGPMVTMLYGTYCNCISLNCDAIIPENVKHIAQAFRNCNNVANVLIENQTLNAYRYSIENCLNRTNYNVRRNIVLRYLAAYNNFINYNGAGYFTKTNETYAEPVEVNVNGISYNCVRCAYNITYNCYIYCME